MKSLQHDFVIFDAHESTLREEFDTQPQPRIVTKIRPSIQPMPIKLKIKP